jgi:hypothetical protein
MLIENLNHGFVCSLRGAILCGWPPSCLYNGIFILCFSVNADRSGVIASFPRILPRAEGIYWISKMTVHPSPRGSSCLPTGPEDFRRYIMFS